MKLIGRLILYAVLLVIVVSFAGTGCNTPPQNVAYKVEGVTITTVNAAVSAWADWVKAHPDTPQVQRDAVHAAYDRYYQAQQVAKAVLEQWVASQSPADQTSYQTANAALSGASANLIQLVRGFLH